MRYILDLKFADIQKTLPGEELFWLFFSFFLCCKPAGDKYVIFRFGENVEGGRGKTIFKHQKKKKNGFGQKFFHRILTKR